MTTHRAGSVTAAGLVALAAFMAVILAANWASTRWPAVPVGELLVPAGAVCAGFAFSLRDLVHAKLGTRGVLVAILAGTGMSWAVASPRIAGASAVAFAASEVVDFAVYTALHARPRSIAMAGSNAAGLVVDSLLFVPLAFGTWTAVSGQVAGKTAATVLSIAVLLASRTLHRAGAR